MTMANSLFPDGIVLAADVDSLDALRLLLDATVAVPQVAAVKLGFSLALRFGLANAVRIVKDRSPMAVIYDHQKAGTDIPQMGKPFAAACHDAGVDALIFFPLAGPRTLEAFVNGALGKKILPIVGLVMSHEAFLESEGGFIRDSAPELIADVAMKLGVDTFVLPGTKPNVISDFAKGKLAQRAPVTIMAPGIGTQGGSLRTALEAARPHRFLPIVGSAIYGAANPEAAMRSFVSQLTA